VRLAEALTGRRDAPREDMARAVAEHGCPVMISSSILSTEHQDHEPELVHACLDLFAGWPDLPVGQLFYTYDALGRFHEVQTGGDAVGPLRYLRWNALGKAILFANDPKEVTHLLQDPAEHPGRRRSLVLIDEIDKAPRDFPNDLLNEIEGMYFHVPELDNARVGAHPAMRPVLILTSNSEKNLAEAFLRRCVFYHIPFPDEERLRHIVEARLGDRITPNRELLDDALKLLADLRNPAAGLSKKPSTGELLAWLQLLSAGPFAVGDAGAYDQRLVEPTLCALVKTEDDRPKARELVLSWLHAKQS
jgi:hypothetical protein